jgi:hypothetical protein
VPETLGDHPHVDPEVDAPLAVEVPQLVRGKPRPQMALTPRGDHLVNRLVGQLAVRALASRVAATSPNGGSTGSAPKPGAPEPGAGIRQAGESTAL